MKIPLAFSIKNRASSLDEDAKLLNAYIETRGDPKKGGIRYAEKRPALDSAFELTSGSGQALYVTNIPNVDGSQSDVLGTVIGDILTRAPTAKTKRLRWGTQPSGVVLNTAFTVTVSIRDSLGNLVNSSANVTIALASNTTGATLGGTLTKAAVSGTATFNDLTMNRSGENFTLRAVSTGLNSVTSNTFDIATTLVFTIQPAPTAIDTDFSTEITVRDSAGNTDTNYNGDITLSFYSNTGGGLLSGILSVTAVAGVALFTGLQIDLEGTYSLQAQAATVSTAYPPTKAVSSSFSIGATHTLVAGQTVPVPGLTFTGFSVSGPVGSISPATLNGNTLQSVGSFSGLFSLTSVTVLGLVSQNFFTSIKVGGTTLTTATASFTQVGAETNWQWVGTELFTTATTYPVTFQ